jgi:hypothetical protein
MSNTPKEQRRWLRGEQSGLLTPVSPLVRRVTTLTLAAALVVLMAAGSALGSPSQALRCGQL